jgi:hypothetical protein
MADTNVETRTISRSTTPIPTLDLRDLAPGASERASALERLRRTVGTIGAFYLVGHGIADETGDELFALTRRFFALPEAERRAIEMANSPHFRGYTGLQRAQGPPSFASRRRRTLLSRRHRRTLSVIATELAEAIGWITTSRRNLSVVFSAW